MKALQFENPPYSAAAETLRVEVRDFLARELENFTPFDRAGSWSAVDPAFSRKVGAQGWIGMTWPKEYGGQERTALERYVVLEEMLAAGAPVAAHWTADRQTGPLLLRFGTEAQKREFLPRFASGDCYVSIGMSEPDAGSDLAAIRTKAEPAPGGYRINGAKIWSSYAQDCHYTLLFCRTSGGPADRHRGTSQLLVDLKTPGVTVRPILDLTGEHHFNEVIFEDAFVSADALIGEEGNGWSQVTSELAYERSGPERFLSSFPLLVELVRVLGRNPPAQAEASIGRLVAHLITLRHMSRSVAWLLEKGENPGLEAAIVKDLGSLLEQEIPEIARSLVAMEQGDAANASFAAAFARTLLNAPSFSLRGGTREILRSIIARGLDLR